MKPTTRKTFIQYCLRALGAPVLQINVDDDQVSDRVDEALQFYQEYHSDSIARVYLKHILTQDDVDNDYIEVDDSVISVQRILPVSHITTSTSGMFSGQYQMFLNQMHGTGFMGNLSEYVQSMQYLELADRITNSLPTIDFSRHENKIRFDSDWKVDLKIGNYIIIEAIKIIDPDTYTKIYNDQFLKRYAIALIKRQWAINLKKFEGLQMPGGVTFNGQLMYDEANNEITQLEEQVRLNWEDPTDFFVG